MGGRVCQQIPQHTLNSEKNKYFVLLLLPTRVTSMEGKERTLQGTGDRSQSVSTALHWKGHRILGEALHGKSVKETTKYSFRNLTRSRLQRHI
jgi:hypothetical protein